MRSFKYLLSFQFTDSLQQQPRQFPNRERQQKNSQDVLNEAKTKWSNWLRTPPASPPYKPYLLLCASRRPLEWWVSISLRAGTPSPICCRQGASCAFTTLVPSHKKRTGCIVNLWCSRRTGCARICRGKNGRIHNRTI